MYNNIIKEWNSSRFAFRSCAKMLQKFCILCVRVFLTNFEKVGEGLEHEKRPNFFLERRVFFITHTLFDSCTIIRYQKIKKSCRAFLTDQTRCKPEGIFYDQIKVNFGIFWTQVTIYKIEYLVALCGFLIQNPHFATRKNNLRQKLHTVFCQNKERFLKKLVALSGLLLSYDASGLPLL